MKNTREFNLYKPYLKTLARNLRKNSPLSEIILWKKLKGRQLLNYKFIRQKPIADYIVDFYCHELKLVIEIDGLSHDFKMKYDSDRQKVLEKTGLYILRFSDEQTREDINSVIQAIVDWIGVKVSHPPTPLKGG